MSERILVAGVGNIFFRDDGFGVEVAKGLRARSLPEGVAVDDYGIRGMHLAFRLLEPLELLIVVDALPRGGAPGSLYLLKPDLAHLGAGAADAHGMDLASVFSSVQSMGGALPRILIVGCEPGDAGAGMGLSEPVSRAVVPAIELVFDVLQREVSSPTVPGEVTS